MGFGTNAKKTAKTTNSAAAAKKSDYVSIGSVWASTEREGQFYISATKDNTKTGFKAPGRLIYQDATTGATYLVKTIYMFDPKKEVNGLAYNLSIKLSNENSVKLLDAGEESAVASEADDTDYDADLTEDNNE